MDHASTGLSFRRPLFESSLKPEVNCEFFQLANVAKLRHLHEITYIS